MWDVDPVDAVIGSYCRVDPDRPLTFVRDQEANAEPTVPGRRMSVDEIMGQVED